MMTNSHEPRCAISLMDLISASPGLRSTFSGSIFGFWSFGMDGSALTVTYTAKGGANGICQVTSSAASGDAGGGANLTLAPAKDQEACLAAVSNKTNNGEVTVLDTNSSEANNTVIVGVGEQKAKWRCLVKNGRVADVMSLTDEGAL